MVSQMKCVVLACTGCNIKHWVQDITTDSATILTVLHLFTIVTVKFAAKI